MKPQGLPHSKFFASVLLSAGLASVALLGGFGIQAVRNDLVNFTPLLVALPAVNAITGDYATLIAAHVGDPQLYQRRVRKLLVSLFISLPFTILGVTVMSVVVSWLQNYPLTVSEVWSQTLFISISLVVIMAALLICVFGINRLLRNRKLNSDDILIPIMNTIASVLVLISFAFIAAKAV